MPDESSYRLCFPFSLQPERAIDGMPDVRGSVLIPVPELSATLSPAPGGYAISVEGFPSPVSAQSFVPMAWLGLTTLMLDSKFAFSASTEVLLGKAVIVSNPSLPSHVQGQRTFVDVGSPYVVPSGAALISVGSFPPTVSMTIPLQRAVAALSRGMAHPRADTLFANPRFRTAVDLFAAAGFEDSGPARLLTYSMAMEVLAPPIVKHDVAQTLIARWHEELIAAKSVHPPTSPEAAALESLERELLVRREASIRWRIRQFVQTTLAAVGATDAGLLARTAVHAYDLRSALVHDGSLAGDALGSAIADFRLVLERLFEAHLQ